MSFYPFPRAVIYGYNKLMSIKDNWKNFQDKLEEAAAFYHRDSDSITVMAVSKTRTVDEIIEAEAAGLKIFGENRVEEASEKFSRLSPVDFPLYLIGHLQSNKVGKINSRFKGVHSVDSLKLARRLSRHREDIQQPLEILLQVNTSGESTKSGFSELDMFRDAAAEIAALPYLKLQGLMTMAPFVDDEKVVRSCFSLCREWSEAIKEYCEDVPVLSMGMSSDYRWAVAEGSNILRIGTALFGGRG